MSKIITASKLNRLWQNGILPIKNHLSNKITTGTALMSNTTADRIPDAIAVKEAIEANVSTVTVDTTLTVSGQAADAKVTGTKLGTKFDSSKRIESYSDLMANAVTGYMADATAVKEGFNTLNNSLEFKTTVPQFANTSALDGSSFNKTFLLCSRADIEHLVNRAAYFEKPANDTTWSGHPTEVTSLTWIGYREVYILNNTHALIKITEFYPTAGRLWFNFYNLTAWTGWKKITPS